MQNSTQVITHEPKPVVSYDWATNSKACYSVLLNAKVKYQDGVKLKPEEVKACNAVLKTIEQFITPFTEASQHPLLSDAEFHDHSEALLESENEKIKQALTDHKIASLYNNVVFAGCGILAYQFVPEDSYDRIDLYLNPSAHSNAKDSPIKPKENILNTEKIPATYVEEDVLKEPLKESNAGFVVKILKKYADKVHSDEELEDSEIERFTRIFSAVKAYLEPYQKIFDSKPLKDASFYPIVFGFTDKDSPLEAKIERMYYAMMDDRKSLKSSQKSSVAGTPISSFNTPISASRRATLSPRTITNKLPFTNSELVESLNNLKIENEEKPPLKNEGQIKNPTNSERQRLIDRGPPPAVAEEGGCCTIL